MHSDLTTRTSATLLRRTADWQDHAAWHAFVARYEPLIQSWCREYHLDDDTAAEVAQLFWIELAEKMRTFRYDPSRRFRGWLRRAFHWRAVDALRERGRDDILVGSLNDPACTHAGDSLLASERIDEDDNPSGNEQLLLLELAEQVQATVRAKVQAQSWQAFWHISIDGWTTRQTADTLHMSYVATHAAHKRVVDRLAAEGERRLAELTKESIERRPARP